MKKVLPLVLLVVAVAAGIWWVTGSDPQEDLLPKVIDRTTEVYNRPYFISNLRKRDFSQTTLTVEEEVPASGQFKSYIVSYPSDGLKVRALMNIPTIPQPRNGFPVVIVNHGYVDPAEYSTTETYKSVTDFYASQGFLVLKPDYRGHGQSESSASSYIERFNYVVDILSLMGAVATIPEADETKLFMYGHSMGGELTLKASEISDQITAASLWAPVAQRFPESLLYFVRRNRSEEDVRDIELMLEIMFTEQDLKELDVILNLSLIQAPLITHHGTADESVPYDWSVQLNTELQQIGKQHTLYTYDRADHNLRGGAGNAWQTAATRDVEFFRSFLE